MKTRMLLAVAALVPGLFLMQANGGNSVAVIDFERAVSQAPGGKDAMTRITTFRDGQVKALQAKQKEADDLETRLRTQDRILAEAARAQLTRELQTARTAVQAMGDETQKKLAQMEQELLVPIEQKTQMAISAYAAEHSVKIVLDASVLQNGLAYVDPVADITTEIIRRIATDLQTPNKRDAAIDPQRFLNRNWMDFGSRGN